MALWWPDDGFQAEGSVMVEIRAFKDAREAVDVGFREGTEDRENGHTSCDLARELREAGAGIRWQRGRGSPFYDEWRDAYEAGFYGLERP
jgi:hypothetical protein